MKSLKRIGRGDGEDREEGRGVVQEGLYILLKKIFKMQLVLVTLKIKPVQPPSVAVYCLWPAEFTLSLISPIHSSANTSPPQYLLRHAPLFAVLFAGHTY